MEETQRSRSRRSSGQAGRLRRCNLPVVARRAITKRLRLLAKNKDAGLPGEAHFLDLAIFADQQGVVAGLGAPVFPAAFGFGDNFATLFHGGKVVAESEGRWEDRSAKSSYDSLLIGENGQVKEVRFSGQSRVFVFGE